MKPRISMIVAMDKKRAIGKTDLGVGKLLWHIPEDLKHFRALTMGHPVIMGRKTFESILSYLNKPFPGRTNIVVTRDKQYKYEGAIVVHSIEEAIEAAKKAEGSEEIFITGGGQIYEQGLPLTGRLYLTLVDGEYDADTFFPEYEKEFTKKVSEEKAVSSSGVHYTWLTLER